MHTSQSLTVLILNGINLRDKGIAILGKLLLKKCPLCRLDLQNNGITTRGLRVLYKYFPPTLSSLDLSYNRFTKDLMFFHTARLLTDTRALRYFNISYSLELKRIDERMVLLFCESITRNLSLSEFVCEGAKIGNNPDRFCELIGQAINKRKLSLTFKISVVNCFTSTSAINSLTSTQYNDISSNASLHPLDWNSQLSSSKVKTSRRCLNFSSSGKSTISDLLKF